MTEEEIHERTRTIIKRFDDLRIVGQGWAGSSRQGFLFNPQSSRSSSGPAGGGGTPGTGGCCFDDGTCAVETLGQCLIDGGTYQGDGTTCDPTGACCMGSSCIITNEDCCTNAGGTYQGDDTLCDPNPCHLPTCPCPSPFRAFDGSDRFFLTMSVTKTDCPCCDADGHLFICTCSATKTIDPITCIETLISNDCCDVPIGGTCGGVGGCCDFSIPGDAIITATHWTQHHHFDGLCDDESCDESGEGTLSDECIPA